MRDTVDDRGDDFAEVGLVYSGSGVAYHLADVVVYVADVVLGYYLLLRRLAAPQRGEFVQLGVYGVGRQRFVRVYLDVIVIRVGQQEYYVKHGEVGDAYHSCRFLRRVACCESGDNACGLDFGVVASAWVQLVDEAVPPSPVLNLKGAAGGGEEAAHEI